LPEIPPGWEEIMLKRREARPDLHALKRDDGD
jgi:hypothetical protein